MGKTHLTQSPTSVIIYSMATIVRDENFIKRANAVKPDSRRRVNLPKALVGKDIMYHIYVNSSGQILLDPQITIPASELWLFKNKKALARMDRGIAEGKSINLGSFAKYVEDASPDTA